MKRVDAGHNKLIEVFDEYKPDALIVIGGDQTEMFDRSNVPQFMIYTGAEASGRTPGYPFGDPNVPQIHTDIEVELSKTILNKLVKEHNFDVAFSSEIENYGRGHGIPHAFANLLSYITSNTNVPTVLVYENTYDPPSLSAKRCYEFGQALTQICQTPHRDSRFGRPRPRPRREALRLVGPTVGQVVFGKNRRWRWQSHPLHVHL